MPARGLYHDAVKNALAKDGWTVTHDPFHIKVGAKDLFVDLGAEQLLGAEKGDRKIAVEVKSFAGPSEWTSWKKRWANSYFTTTC